MATAYGSALGLDSTGLLLALLVTQIVAFPCSIIFGRLTKKFKASALITVCIIAYTGIALFAMVMSEQAHFWFLAVCVGMFQGGVQALSRSWFAKIVRRKVGGILRADGHLRQGASFMGTAIVSAVSQVSGNISTGVGMIAILFVVGLVLFGSRSRQPPGPKRAIPIPNQIFHFLHTLFPSR